MEESVVTARKRARKYAAYLVVFGIAALGALALSKTIHSDYNTLYLPVYFALVAAFVVVFLRMRLQDLRRDEKLHGLLLSIAERGIVTGLVRAYVSRRRRPRGLISRLSLVAGMIAALVVILDAKDVLFERNLALLELFPWLAPGAREGEGSTGPTPPAGDGLPLGSLFIATNGRGTEERLELMLKVTKDLVDAGARVIVFEPPETVNRPYYKSLIARIQDSGPVVWAVQRNSFDTHPLSWSQGMLDGGWILLDSVIQHWGLLTAERGQFPFFGRPVYFVPFAYRVNRYPGGMSDTVSDVSLEILRRWKSYPDSLTPVPGSEEIAFGEYRIPVSRSGIALCPFRRDAQLGFLPVTGLDMPDGTGFKYTWGNWDSDHMGNDLHPVADRIRGTIVFVTWSDPVERRGAFSGGWYDETVVLRAAVRGQFYTVRDRLQVPATIVFVILSLVATLGLRPWKGALLTAFLGGVILLGSAWLYWKALVIVEVIYPVLCAGLCALLLPLAKIAWEAEQEPYQSNSTLRAD